MQFADLFLIAFSLFFILLIATVIVHMLFLVPFVPSRMRVVKKMITAARLKQDDVVFDLGCGDGRILFEAEKKLRAGTRNKAVGFEIAPLVYFLAWARKFFARSRANIRFQSFFAANLRRANVIFCYLIPNVMPRLAAKIKKECKKGTRIVSNTFHIPGLKLVRILRRDRQKGIPTIYVYKV